MMGSSDNSSLTISNSCNARKLRPLIPKPNIFPTTNPSSPSCVGFSNSQELFSLHGPSGGEQSRPELGAQVSSRWNPTPEQLRTLEDLYRRGMRTPSADQIQYITSQLRRYGKVEGKNVFYWFQNHKARERQKLRRRTEAALELDCLLDRKDSASCWVGFEQSKDWLPRNCSISPEEPLLFSIPEKGQTPPERLWKKTFQLYGDNLTSHHQNANIEKIAVREEANKEDKDRGETCKIETLQLFPLHSDGINSSTPTTNNSFTIPTFNHSHHDLIQFFQFLPLKN